MLGLGKNIRVAWGQLHKTSRCRVFFIFVSVCCMQYNWACLVKVSKKKLRMFTVQALPGTVMLSPSSARHPLFHTCELRVSRVRGGRSASWRAGPMRRRAARAKASGTRPTHSPSRAASTSGRPSRRGPLSLYQTASRASSSPDRLLFTAFQ